MIGTAELKANHSIQQIVEVISDHEKYPRYGLLAFYRIYLVKFL
jgi:ATP-dependent RNA helicase DDX5/DBP2